MPLFFIKKLRALGVNDAELAWLKEHFYRWFCPDWSEMFESEYNRLAVQCSRMAKAKGYVP